MDPPKAGPVRVAGWEGLGKPPPPNRGAGGSAQGNPGPRGEARGDLERDLERTLRRLAGSSGKGAGGRATGGGGVRPRAGASRRRGSTSPGGAGVQKGPGITTEANCLVRVAEDTRRPCDPNLMVSRGAGPMAPAAVAEGGAWSPRARGGRSTHSKTGPSRAGEVACPLEVP